MKKIISLIICFSLIASPSIVLAQTFEEQYSTTANEYDFSDEAQVRFNQNINIYTPNYIQPQYNNNLSGEKYKKTKEKTKEHLEEVNLAPQVPKQLELPKYDPNAALHGAIVYIPEGTIFDIQLQSGISSGSFDENDKLTAILPSNWIYNGNLIAPAGSLVYGTAVDTTPAGYAYGSGAMELTFDKIMTPDGKMYNILTETVRFENKSERGKNMTRDVLIGAGVGLLTGLLFSALGANCYGSGDRDYGQAMLIYGAAGAAGGGIKGVASRGSDVRIDADTIIPLKLLRPLEVIPQNAD